MSAIEQLPPLRKVPETAPLEVKRFTRTSLEGEIRFRRFDNKRIGWVSIVIHNDPEIAKLCEALSASWTANLESGWTVAQIAALLPEDPNGIAVFALKMLQALEATAESPPENHRSAWPLVRNGKI